jgi:O-antigen/teichoic acid export membrane protein
MSLSRGASLSIVSAVTQMAVTIVTVPIYLKLIGLERYGVVVIVWLIFDYLQLFNFGLDKATTTLLSKNRTTESAGSIVQSGMLLALLAGFIGALFTAVFLPAVLTALMGVQLGALAEAGSSLLVIAATLPIWALGSVATGVLLTDERFFALNVSQLSMSVLFQVAPLGIARWLSRYRLSSSHGPL